MRAVSQISDQIKPFSDTQTFKKLPSVASFRRCHVVSDASMFSVLPDDSEKPVGIYRVGIRGTQNVNDGIGNTHQKKNGDEGDRGVQQALITEIARIDSDASAMMVRFGLSMLDINQSLDMCNDHISQAEAKRFRQSINDFVARAKRGNAIDLLAQRYARNIANGRWLWRNRTHAASILIKVATRDGKHVAEFDAKKVSMTNFTNPSPQELALAKSLADQMRGLSYDGLIVEARLTMLVGGSVEVFPSQNYAEKDRRRSNDQPDESIRSLYKARSVNAIESDDAARGMLGYAAIRDQKIFNAIRTIDTWYAHYDEMLTPIPVEPLGASIAHQEFYRRGDDSAFEMFRSLAQIAPESDAGLYCLACIERGGVYGPAKSAAPKKEEKSIPKNTISDTERSIIESLSTEISDKPLGKSKKPNSVKAKTKKQVSQLAGAIA